MMASMERARRELAALAGLRCVADVALAAYTRFGIGGPAGMLCDADSEAVFLDALRTVRAAGVPFVILGQGSNVIAADGGFAGVVLRFTGGAIAVDGTRIRVAAGAELQALVDASIEHRLAGLHTMTRIPGWVGAAIYGNAGAYGHSVHEFVREVRFFDGATVRAVDNAGCEFAYRESIFKRHKDWIILSAMLELAPGDAAALQTRADEIGRIRDAKYPPSMRCAGSIFKNLLMDRLPEAVQREVPPSLVRENKVPAAWFLEQVGAKGVRRGDIQVATYHANLIYNDGAGRAVDLCAIIDDLKRRVEQRFGFSLEEEVQYVGF